MSDLSGFSTMVTQSVLTRFLANIFAFLLLISALVVCCVEIVRGEQVNQYVSLVLGTGIGYSLHLLGLSQGVTLEPLKAPSEKE